LKYTTIMAKSSKWQGVYSLDICENGRDVTVLQVSRLDKLDNKTFFVMNISLVTNGKFTKRGISLNNQEAQFLINVLKFGYHPMLPTFYCRNKDRRIDIAWNPKNIELTTTAFGVAKPALLVHAKDENLLKRAIETGIEYMTNKRKCRESQPMECD
jgi:hypothetical protein